LRVATVSESTDMRGYSRSYSDLLGWQGVSGSAGVRRAPVFVGGRGWASGRVLVAVGGFPVDGDVPDLGMMSGVGLSEHGW
jgi:hypothetical protein